MPGNEVQLKSDRKCVIIFLSIFSVQREKEVFTVRDGKGEVCGVKPGETPGQAVERLTREIRELQEANYILRKALGFMAGR